MERVLVAVAILIVRELAEAVCAYLAEDDDVDALP